MDAGNRIMYEQNLGWGGEGCLWRSILIEMKGKCSSVAVADSGGKSVRARDAVRRVSD